MTNEDMADLAVQQLYGTTNLDRSRDLAWNIQQLLEGFSFGEATLALAYLLAKFAPKHGQARALYYAAIAKVIATHPIEIEP